MHVHAHEASINVTPAYTETSDSLVCDSFERCYISDIPLCTAEMPLPDSHQTSVEVQVAGTRRAFTYTPQSSPLSLGMHSTKRPRTESPHIATPLLQGCNINFFENEREACEVEKLQSHLFTYVVIKCHSNDETPPHVTSNIKAFMNSCNPKPNPPISNVHYLALVNENPDSEDTLLHISEDLLEKLSHECQNNFVFVVGDGKTYQHLMKIKKKYGCVLEKLLIYPGDWHLLKNFQEVLMKQYYYSGLKEIAMSSGYKGGTLRALETLTLNVHTTY